MEEEVKSFKERVHEQISGPPTKRVSITFPQEVFDSLDAYAKEFSADCYWLAIKQLLDFRNEQLEGDLKTSIIMQQISDVKTDLESVKNELFKVQNKKKETNFQTFGKREE